MAFRAFTSPCLLCSSQSEQEISPENEDDPVEGFLQQNDAVRLLELINSPPPIPQSSPSEEGGFKWRFSSGEHS